MGIVHKLKPEVLNFILENKQQDPALSCRNLTQLILEKLQIKVSKSSINAIFKEHNLSMPAGRRQKQKRKKFNMPILPVIEGTKAVMVVTEPGSGVASKPVQEPVVNPSLRGAVGDEANTKSEIASGTPCPRNDETKEEVFPEQKNEEINPQEKRLKEAEEWAMKLQEEERIRIEEKLRLEKQRSENEDIKKKAEETEVRALLEEAAKVKVKEEERQRQQEEIVKAGEERKRLEEEAKRIAAEKASRAAEEERLKEEQAKKAEEERAAQVAAEKKLEEEKIAQEAKLKAEEARLAKLAEEETKRIEEETLAQEAALKAEKERWAQLAEQEYKAKQQKAEGLVLPKEEPVSAISPLPQEQSCSGVILLQALDGLIGGSKKFNEAIAKEMGVAPESISNLTEAVIFRSLFGKENMDLCNLTGQQYPFEKLDNYSAQIQQLKNIKSELLKILPGIFTEARGVKIHFIDGNEIYLDGQLHTSWPTQNIPYDFSSSLYELKNNLNMYFGIGTPLVLFSAPGYDVAPKDFFNLLINLGSTDKYPDNLTLFGSNLEELGKISLDNKNNHSFVFGLWPWQFTSSRKVKKIGEFSLRRIEGIDKDFYLADIEIDLLQATTNQIISLKGSAIKVSLTEKIRLVVLNSSKEPMALDKLAGIYLKRWPNLDEAFHDFSRKTELFAYVSSAQKSFSKDGWGTEIDNQAPTLELDAILAKYIKILDAYLRWYFLPSAYVDKNLSFTKEHLYKIPVKLITGKNKITAQIQVKPADQFLKDTEYLMRRLNERQINLAAGVSVHFENAFK